MRYLFALILLLIAAPAFAGDLVMKGDGLSVRLTTAPCAVAVANEQVKAEHKDAQRQGSVTVGGRVVALCWLRVGDVIWSMDEDGGITATPVQEFSVDNGV